MSKETLEKPAFNAKLMIDHGLMKSVDPSEWTISNFKDYGLEIGEALSTLIQGRSNPLQNLLPGD